MRSPSKESITEKEKAVLHNFRGIVWKNAHFCCCYNMILTTSEEELDHTYRLVPSKSRSLFANLHFGDMLEPIEAKVHWVLSMNYQCIPWSKDLCLVVLPRRGCSGTFRPLPDFHAWWRARIEGTPLWDSILPYRNHPFREHHPFINYLLHIILTRYSYLWQEVKVKVILYFFCHEFKELPIIWTDIQWIGWVKTWKVC
jgi:hypothetical protein